MYQGKITGTLTSRVLLEAGYSINNESYTTGEMEPSAAARDNAIPRYDRVLQTYWGAQSPFPTSITSRCGGPSSAPCRT
jgi:hypothetical protein